MVVVVDEAGMVVAEVVAAAEVEAIDMAGVEEVVTIMVMAAEVEESVGDQYSFRT